MKRPVLFLLVICFGAFYSRSQDSFGDCERFFLKLYDSYDANPTENHKLCSKYLDSLIDCDPKNSFLHVIKGEFYRNIENYSKAFDAYNIAIKMSQHPRAYYERGMLFIYKDRAELALPDLDNAIKYSRNRQERIDYSIKKSRLYDNSREFNEAHHILWKVYENEVKGNDTIDFRLNLDLAASFFNLAKPDSCFLFLNQAKAICPDHPAVYSNKGYYYSLMGIIDSAIFNLEKALSIGIILDSQTKVRNNQNKGSLLNNLGFCYLMKHDLKKAQELFIESEDLYPYNSMLFKNKALLFIELEEFEMACVALSKAEELQFTYQFGSEVSGLKKDYCE